MKLMINSEFAEKREGKAYNFFKTVNPDRRVKLYPTTFAGNGNTSNASVLKAFERAVKRNRQVRWG